ncbi:MAG: GNAT family N-acetyltransferase [Evtepia gabavorous]
MVQVLRTVAHLTVALDDTGARWAFWASAAIAWSCFSSPNQQGKGLGSRLFQHAMAKHYLAQITVWEANTRALGFFLRRSYRVHHRTPADPQGHPFPTLYLTLSCY